MSWLGDIAWGVQPPAGQVERGRLAYGPTPSLSHGRRSSQQSCGTSVERSVIRSVLRWVHLLQQVNTENEFIL